MPSAKSASSVALGVSMLLWANLAHAYCPEVTKAPPANYDPAKSGCFLADPSSGAPLPALFWRNRCVGYSLQKGASRQISLADATRVAGEAFAAWGNASCANGLPSIAAIAQDPVDCSEVPSKEHNNAIIFRDNGWPYQDSANTLGYTKLTVNTLTGEIYGADIEINSTDYKLVGGGVVPAGGYDLATVLTHEAGHFLGLAHSAQSNAIMFTSYHAGSAALTPDDVAGICSMYPPDGTRNTPSGPMATSSCCDSSPRRGFLTECGSLDAGVVPVCAAVGPGDVGDDAASAWDGGAVCSPGKPSCSVSACGLSARTPSVLGLVVIVAMGVRARRRVRGATAALAVSLAVLCASAFDAHEANASVSVGALFEELVERASAAAVVTPVSAQTRWEDGSIVTYTRVHVDQLVAGQLEGDAWVRTLGGAVGSIAQIVEGEATLAVGKPSLLFVHPHFDVTTRVPTGTVGVVERAQGQYPIVSVEGQKPRLGVATDMGAVLPPPTMHWTRAKRLGHGVEARLARRVLDGRSLEDVTREIAAAWARIHS